MMTSHCFVNNLLLDRTGSSSRLAGIPLTRADTFYEQPLKFIFPLSSVDSIGLPFLAHQILCLEFWGTAKKQKWAFLFALTGDLYFLLHQDTFTTSTATFCFSTQSNAKVSFDFYQLAMQLRATHCHHQLYVALNSGFHLFEVLPMATCHKYRNVVQLVHFRHYELSVLCKKWEGKY